MKNGQTSIIPKILLSLLIGMLVVAGITVMLDQPVGNRGLPHSVYPKTMFEGGSGVERLGGVRWLGLAFALCQVGIFVNCILLGMRRAKKRTVIISMIGSLYAAAFVALTITDLSYAQGGTRAIIGGFPAPTAIMMYAVGGLPVLFVLGYSVLFDTWVMTPDEQSRIERLAVEYQESRESSS